MSFNLLLGLLFFLEDRFYELTSVRFLGDLTLSDEIILVSFNFSGTESDFLLNFCLLLLDISLLISHLIDHTFFFEIFLSCFSLDSSLLPLLFFEFALQVLEERH